MNWPLPQDFNEAVQNPQTAFADPDLKAGQPVVGPRGLPLPRSGNFADVYQIRGADGRDWAVKCFTRRVFGLDARYAKVGEALTRASLPFGIGFTFLSEGIRVRGEWRPAVKMEWVEGLLLNQVARDNRDRPAVLAALAEVWSRLCKRLRDAGVAHADLQHANVILVPGSRPGAFGLKLIDYDGMYVPALANSPSGEAGHPNYQHPRRAPDRVYSPDLDRFPHLVIATALKGLECCGPTLWDRYDTGDNLLFVKADFRNPATSPLMRELWGSGHPAVTALVGRLAVACNQPLPQTPWLDEVAPDGLPLPLDPAARRAAATALGFAAPTAVWTGVSAAAATPAGRFAAPHVGAKPARPAKPAVETFPVRPVAIGIGVLFAVGIGVGALLLLAGKKEETARTLGTDVRIQPPGPGPGPSRSPPVVGPTTKEGQVPPEPRPAVELAAGAELGCEIAPGTRMVFCWIPSGKAVLGSPKGEKGRLVYETEHEFATPGFWLGKYEVTQGEWTAVMGYNPSSFDGKKPGPVQGLDTSRFPVEVVTWDDCLRFLERLNSRPGAVRTFPRPGRFCLPHEDEWEYACRGGQGNQRPFYWGTELNGTQANCDGKLPYGTAVVGASLWRPTVVGSYAKNHPHPWGLCDMLGNVWEFCESRQPRPPGPDTRVIRGGCYGDGAVACQAANRNFPGPSTPRYHNLGLRVCFRPD